MLKFGIKLNYLKNFKNYSILLHLQEEKVC